ncbi:ETS domain-containing protein Elk-1-like [Xenia sp. Carnegie-2017]|uniref:ETS domain-containing protein Elk-1-like n=1 Tax=Xenia sp. Carnegie-2017 TaxID=2897299 RepID=UPI001F04E9AD|nr:ETS domain-containing protein Elk-1-like [Xenia sp. Carnegie-2017]
MSKTKVRKPWQSGKYTVYLWEFLYSLLQDHECQSLISWTNQEIKEFRMKNVKEIAKLWGTAKNRPTMDDKKLLRALRYYYKTNILRKIKGQKGVYQFLSLPYEVEKKSDDLNVENELESETSEQPVESNTWENMGSGGTDDLSSIEEDSNTGDASIACRDIVAVKDEQTVFTNVYDARENSSSSSESTESGNENSAKYMEDIKADIIDVDFPDSAQENMDCVFENESLMHRDF